MEDYIPITEAQSDPEAVVDSSLIKRLRDNPLAIARGAPGARRIEGAALKRNLLGAIETTVDTTAIEFLDLDAYVAVRVQADRLTRRGSSASVSVQVSSNNGGSWLTVSTRDLLNEDITSTSRLRGSIFIEADPLRSFYYGVGVGSAFGGGPNVPVIESFSGISSINAIRLAVTSGSGVMRDGARFSAWGVVREEET